MGGREGSAALLAKQRAFARHTWTTTPSLHRSPRSYDIHPDGQRFLMIKEAPQTEEASAPTELILVLNWSEELKRLVPTDR